MPCANNHKTIIAIKRNGYDNENTASVNVYTHAFHGYAIKQGEKKYFALYDMQKSLLSCGQLREEYKHRDFSYPMVIPGWGKSTRLFVCLQLYFILSDCFHAICAHITRYSFIVFLKLSSFIVKLIQQMASFQLIIFQWNRQNSRNFKQQNRRSY